MAESRPVVRIPQGELRGIIEEAALGGKYASFKGIPYAKPPVGELKFRDPEPAEPWSSTLDASHFGPNCAQLEMVTRKYAGSDDCLYLNVYTQTDFQSNSHKSKPVMVWIHGGAFMHGSGDDFLYGPDYIVTKDIVVVTINYRLGALGFLDLGIEEASGNQGLKDQVLALKWVQKNISHFGGDPKNVTIFGESAGSASIHYLTLSPMAEGLFHKAIAQSGVAPNPWANLPSEYPKKLAIELAALLGKVSDDPKVVLEFLRTVDPLKLAKVDFELYAKRLCPGFFTFAPSPDPKAKKPFFPKPVTSAVQSGVKVPLLLGYMSHEGILFLHEVDSKLKEFDSNIENALSPAALNMLKEKNVTPADLREMYFGDKPISKETLYNYMELQSDLQFIAGIHDIANIQAKKTECPTYLYRFSYDSGESFVKSALGLTMPGACHADDLAYVLYPKLQKTMGIPPAAPGSIARLLIDRVTKMWTDFAKTGNPTPAVSDLVPIIWKPVKTVDNLECLEITEDLEMITVPTINKKWAEKSKSKL